jgi:hypothetical protein
VTRAKSALHHGSAMERLIRANLAQAQNKCVIRDAVATGDRKPVLAADADAGAVDAAGGDRPSDDRPSGDDSAMRAGATRPVNALRADDGVCFDGERRKEKNRSQRGVKSCFHQMRPPGFRVNAAEQPQ